MGGRTNGPICCWLGGIWGGSVFTVSSMLMYSDAMDCSGQALLSMRFSRQEDWSALPCPLPEDLPDPGIEPTSLKFPSLAGGFLSKTETLNAFPCKSLFLSLPNCSSQSPSVPSFGSGSLALSLPTWHHHSTVCSSPTYISDLVPTLHLHCHYASPPTSTSPKTPHWSLFTCCLVSKASVDRHPPG